MKIENLFIFLIGSNQIVEKTFKERIGRLNQSNFKLKLKTIMIEGEKFLRSDIDTNLLISKFLTRNYLDVLGIEFDLKKSLREQDYANKKTTTTISTLYEVNRLKIDLLTVLSIAGEEAYM